MAINISRKMQIKTTIRYRSTLTRMAIMKKFGEQQVLGRMQRNQKPHIILVGKYSGIATLANSLAVSHIIKDRVTLWASNSTGYMVELKWKMSWEICLNKNLYMNFYIINHDSEKVEYGNIHTIEYYSTIQRNETDIDTCYTIDRPWKHAKWKKPVMKTMYFMIPFIWNVHSEKPSPKETWD